MSRQDIFIKSPRQENQHTLLLNCGPIPPPALWRREMPRLSICHRRGFLACSWCCEWNGRLHHVHCKAALIMRNQAQNLAPNWSINNGNGLMCIQFAKQGSQHRDWVKGFLFVCFVFPSSLPEWQNRNTETRIGMYCPWPGDKCQEFERLQAELKMSGLSQAWVAFVFWLAKRQGKERFWIC